MNIMEIIERNSAQTEQEKQEYSRAVLSGRAYRWRVQTARCVFNFKQNEYFKALFVARATRNKVQAVFV